MNLIIDVGNTYIKIGIFQDSVLLHKQILKLEVFLEEIKELQQKFPKIKNAIISSVSSIKKHEVEYIQKSFYTLVLDHTIKLPFENLYETPKTLGVDRIALVAAAVHQFSQKNCLIIDAGTCITYDFKNKKEEYLGGAIAPGIRLRYRSLHDFTSKLPLLDTALPNYHIGNTTNQAIHSGIVLGVLYEIEGAIAEYCNTYPDLTVILTGGDAHFLSKRLKNSIFATSNFLLEGLNYILAFNNSQ